MVLRTLSKTLLTLTENVPSVMIVAPRGSGCSLLLNELFPNHHFVDFENFHTLNTAKENPTLFLKQFRRAVVIENIQLFPDILRYIGDIADLTQRPGSFILSSHRLDPVMAALPPLTRNNFIILKCLSFSRKEVDLARPQQSFDLLERLFYGGYPDVVSHPEQIQQWMSGHIHNVYEKDIISEIPIRQSDAFRSFLTACAACVGQPVNMSYLGHHCGVSHNTAKAWHALIASCQWVFSLPAFRYRSKRQTVKAPKLYFYDSGLLCYLLQIPSPEAIATHPLKPLIFENFIVSEAYKHLISKGQAPNLFYWRDKLKNDIKMIYEPERGNRVQTKIFDIQWSNRIHNDSYKSLNFWKKLTSGEFLDGKVIGTQSEGDLCLDWNRLDTVF